MEWICKTLQRLPAPDIVEPLSRNTAQLNIFINWTAHRLNRFTFVQLPSSIYEKSKVLFLPLIH